MPLWPSKIGTRRGDVIKDARLQESFKIWPLPDRSLDVPFGGQYDIST